ncbi:histone H1.8 [Rhinoderma darwinii]|uniref:histone H1.8 n=1 Tax=Rhinoderma darwinii TaxID=43563 RepID=UPI003F66D0BD
MKSLGHPPTLSMVVEVLKKSSERKGTSVPAIRAHILAAHPTVDPVRLKFLLRSALNKGIEKGILVRPANSSATGATGRFKLAKPGTKSKEGSDSKISENADPNVQSKETKEKATKKVAKKVSKKPEAEKEESQDEKTEEAKVTEKKEKTPAEPKMAKPKKEAPEKTAKAPAPAKKPKSKAAEEGAKPKKEPAKKAESAKAKETEKTTARSSKKGKK